MSGSSGWHQRLNSEALWGTNIRRKCYALPMPLRLCTVSFKSPTGITHGVDVEAETLYEAAGLGLARLKRDGWIEGLGPGSRLEIHVREPVTIHSLTVQQLHRWVDGVTTSPAEVLRRTRVKHLLGR
jgi:hypothetical protein